MMELDANRWVNPGLVLLAEASEFRALNPSEVATLSGQPVAEMRLLRLCILAVERGESRSWLNPPADVPGWPDVEGSTHPLVVGGFSNGTQSFDGHIDEFALWKGLAVYPGGTTFTPEAAAYPNPGAGTGNVTVEWDRRTRLRTNPTNGYVPVGEATESYEVVVYTTSGYVTPVRTITGLTSSSWEYTRDHQIADFGSQQATVYADIFQISAVVGRGYPLRGAF